MLWHYTEKKLNNAIKKKTDNKDLLDLGVKTRFLLSGSGKHTIANRLSRYLIAISIFILFELFIFKGSYATTTNQSTAIIILVLFNIFMIAFVITAFLQNKMRKKNYELIIKDINSSNS